MCMGGINVKVIEICMGGKSYIGTTICAVTLDRSSGGVLVAPGKSQ